MGHPCSSLLLTSRLFAATRSWSSAEEVVKREERRRRKGRRGVARQPSFRTSRRSPTCLTVLQVRKRRSIFFCSRTTLTSSFFNAAYHLNRPLFPQSCVKYIHSPPPHKKGITTYLWPADSVCRLVDRLSVIISYKGGGSFTFMHLSEHLFKYFSIYDVVIFGRRSHFYNYVHMYVYNDES